MRHPNLPKALNECVAQNVLTGFPTCKDYTSKAEALEFGVGERHYCDGKNCFTREKRADYESRLHLVDGLKFADVIERVPIPLLDPVIISHDFDITLTINPSVYGSAIATPYWHVPGLLSLNPALSMNFRTRYGLSQDQLLVLHGEGHDDILERLYIRSCDPRFWDVCASVSPVLLIAPGYSIYSDGSQCRHWQPYNLQRSAKFFSDANSHGLPCVPWVASNHDRDTQRICEWLNKQCHSVVHVAVNFQTRGPEVLEENIRFARTVETACTRKIHWLVFGVACRTSMSQFAESLTGPVTFVTGKPTQRGRAGRSIHGQDKVIDAVRQEDVDHNVLEQRKLTETVMSSRYRKN